MLGVMSSACGSSKSPTEPNRSADIAGRVTQVTTTGTFTGIIRVETVPSDNTGSPKAIATVDGVTVIFRLDRAEGEFRSLAVGQWVRVWFDGPVQESYPVRGLAGTVTIDSAAVSIN